MKKLLLCVLCASVVQSLAGCAATPQPAAGKNFTKKDMPWLKYKALSAICPALNKMHMADSRNLQRPYCNEA